MQPIRDDDSQHTGPDGSFLTNESRDYGSMEMDTEEMNIEADNVPSNHVVSMSVIAILAGVFMFIAGIGKLFIHDEKAYNNLVDGLLAAYLLAFFLAFFLGGGTAFLYIPEMLSNAVTRTEAPISDQNEVPVLEENELA